MSEGKIINLSKRLASLEKQNPIVPPDFDEEMAAITAIVLEVWPTFEEDNSDLLSPGGVSRCFADPRYREIERRVFARMEAQTPSSVNADGV
ncbi:MAG TPA: hypothetical protein PKM50_08070 [Methanoregula sp.]|nr:hypothetical protein [Methanoregula sp.]